MVHRKATAGILAAAWTLAVITVLPSTGHAQVLFNKPEQQCSAKVAKAGRKVAKTYAKENAKCRDADISGKAANPDCTTTTQTNDKVSKAITKAIGAAEKSCGAFCAPLSNTIPCLANSLCPPQLNAGPELCAAPEGGTATGESGFDMGNLGFPGPFCEGILGRSVQVSGDLGECVGLVIQQPAQSVADVVYGSIDGTSGISGSAAKCVAGLSKAAQKLADTVFNGIIKCRSAIQTGKVQANPATCTTDDEKLAAKIAKAEDKLRAAVDKCADTDIPELDLCANGPGGTIDKDSAKTCLVAAVREISDTTLTGGARQPYAAVTLVEAPYPPSKGVCGDNVINQIPNPFALIGEECDGTDDAACPDECFPPGDVFECTCPSNRLRFLADGLSADLDSGWTGTSHNSGVTDGAGFVINLENCDCNSFTGATCTGDYADKVCDVTSTYQLPQCSWDIGSGIPCDARGTDPGGANTDNDCYICDQFSANAGAFCRAEALGIDDCQSQCYDGNGTPVGPCNSQTDCAAGQVCRGICDTTPTCVIQTNGAPLPISAGATPVCIETTFRFDIFGTSDIVTGEHELFIQQFSSINLGASVLSPCPVCGGYCAGLPPSSILFGRPCEGTCSVTSSQGCRFDADCPTGESCSDETPECGDGYCNLSLVCGGGSVDNFGGPNAGQACRIEAYTDKFGTVSGDCPPLKGGKNVGTLQINFFPQTSEQVSLPNVTPCTALGNSNYDCPCPQAGGVETTRQNKCAFACNLAGPQFGQGCGTGSDVNGFATTCSNSGAACDEDADCPGGTCTDNPRHCEGDLPGPASSLTTCSVNADCGTGTCVDACTGGICLPLCLPSDDPRFPPTAGKFPDDPQEGLCAAGPFFSHCANALEDFIPCPPEVIGTGCDAKCTDGVTPCTDDTDCTPGETCSGNCSEAKNCAAGLDGIIGTVDDIPGAGLCIPDVRNCFVNEAFAEGGDTLNGGGDPTNVRSVSAYCIAGTGNSAVDATSGLGGPGRLRQTGLNVPAYTSLP